MSFGFEACSWGVSVRSRARDGGMRHSISAKPTKDSLGNEPLQTIHVDLYMASVFHVAAINLYRPQHLFQSTDA